MANRAKGAYESTVQMVCMTWNDPNDGRCIEWAADYHEAHYRANIIRKLYGFDKAPTIELAIEKVPVSPKSALLAWLNTYLTRDNG